MGKVYKSKRHSCKMCKPQKMGWAPKHTDRQRMESALAEEEMEHEKETHGGTLSGRLHQTSEVKAEAPDG